MSSLGDRFRRAAAGVAEALGLRRPGTTLVRVGQPPPLRPAAAPVGEPRALLAPPYPRCPSCGERHPRLPLQQPSLAAYGRSLLPDPTRPAPLGRGPGHDRALDRDQHRPWR